jgi:hypothetical protein
MKNMKKDLEMLEGINGYKFRNDDDKMFYPNDTIDMTPTEILDDIKISFVETFMVGRDYDCDDCYVELYKGGEGYVGCDDYPNEIRFDYY